jgi:hypothetical protein
MSISDSISNPKICEFPRCGRPVRAKGLCFSHYAQKSRGRELQALHESRRPRGGVPRIICDEVPCRKMGTPCHVFRASKTNGYGMVSGDRPGGKRGMVGVHKIVWEREVGPVPRGMVLDHECMVMSCCNADHLRVVTRKVNNTENSNGQGAINKAKTHCKNGHEFSESNTKLKAKRGSRICVACSKEYERLRWLRQKKAEKIA